MDSHGDRFDLTRFVEAQDAGDTYEQALEELRDGRKRSHWMWFVFPQLAGLGHSATARRYAIASLEEARAYLTDPVLGPRLRACAEALLAHLGADAGEILGGTDARKLRSSMTLFARAADEPGSIYEQVLGHYFGGSSDEASERLPATRRSPG